MTEPPDDDAADARPPRRDRTAPPADPTLASWRELARRRLELGEPLAAYDAASDGLRRWPRDLELRQLRGLSLSRSGAIEDASAAFRELVDEGHGDEETLGNLARTYKAMWLSARGSRAAEPLRRQAHQAYLDAYQRTGGTWSCINAATLALAGGDRAAAAELAAAALATCQALLAAGTADSDDAYWLRATCGEAALLLGDVEAADRWYRDAVAAAGKRYAHVASTRSQARMVCELAGVDWPALAECFALPRIVVCTGHMIDAPDRPAPRFPPQLAEAVEREIKRRLAAWPSVIGYASAACGADLLFLEALAARGDDAVVVLPFAADEFAVHSVEFAGDDWRTRFDAALARCGEPIVASSWKSPPSGAAYDYANRMLSGLAKIQADLLDVPATLLAIWDGQSQTEPGGAASLVRRWQRRGLPVEEVDLRALAAAASAEVSSDEVSARQIRTTDGAAASEPADERGAPPARAPRRRDSPELVAMLFADIQGFSNFSDEQIVPFVRRLLDRVARLMRAGGEQPLGANTWGDGFFATFRCVGEAGRFALRLARLVHDTDWQRHGLPADLNIRIALHAGPAYALRDPVTGRPSYWGGHVSRAARLEPITPPGQVYASQAFAALARDDGDCEFDCRYVGRTPLAKNYGSFPTYHVTPKRRRRR